MSKKEIETVAYPEYRCRRCGKVFTKGLVELPNIMNAVRNANYAHLCYIEDETRKQRLGTSETSDSIRFFYAHICADNARGVADLIGTTPPLQAIMYRNKWINPQTKEEIPYQLSDDS